jgi:hypothetical protein
MSLAAKERARDYTWARYAGRLLNAIHRVSV